LTTDDRLSAAILEARYRWRELFPPKIRWEPESQMVGTDIGKPDQRLTPAVPTVPTVPTKKRDTPSWIEPDAHVAAWVEWVERSAIYEFSGGLTRAEAEAKAAQDMREIASRGGMVV
jgi:hypothetical protein